MLPPLLISNRESRRKFLLSDAAAGLYPPGVMR